MPRSSGQLPVYYNSRASYHAMGYHDLPDTPLFTFGDGLSYTEFVCGGVHLSSETAAFTFEFGYRELAIWDAAMRFTMKPAQVQILLEDGGKILWQGTLQILV